MLISLELLLAHSLRVLRAVRIALKRTKVRMPIPRTSIERVDEGRVDSKHVEDLSRHLECTRIMLMAPCAKIPMLSKKVHGCQKSKVLCTREFAVAVCASSASSTVFMTFSLAMAPPQTLHCSFTSLAILFSPLESHSAAR